MKQVKNGWFLLVLVLVGLACKEEYPADCAGYSAAIYKQGCSYADGSYENFGNYAIFNRERLADTVNGGWMHDNTEKSISLSSINDFCAEKMIIDFSNLLLENSDTILLSYSNLGLSQIFPTARLDYLDADAVLETYHLVEEGNNWLIIDAINADTTIVQGRFQASFVTSFEPYLTGERKRWDDPNRPDTLHFRNGQFEAVFRSF